MTIGEAFKLACKELKVLKVPYTEDEIRTLLAHIIGQTKSFIIINNHDKLNSLQEENFKHALDKKKNFYPLAYIIGQTSFYNSDFIVNEKVLIPRPETESLVERSLKELKKLKKAKIIDFGCGSGCIGLSLIKEMTDSEVLLVDISAEAIEVANRNAEKLKLLSRVKFLDSAIEDLSLSKLTPMGFSQVDLVVANPPYIAFNAQDIELSVRNFEPKIALYGGEQGWEKYENWAKKANEFLKPEGLFVTEIGYDQKEPLKNFFSEQVSWKNIEFLKDLSHRDRIMILQKRN